MGKVVLTVLVAKYADQAARNNPINSMILELDQELSLDFLASSTPHSNNQRPNIDTHAVLNSLHTRPK